MTYKELLNSVNFDDVATQIVRMYPDAEHSLGWYRLHFDMLRLMTPKYHDDANDDVCHITMKDWDDGTGKHLDAYPMEGDLWEHSLTKELILSPGVKATNEELAACCLWHTSFYGFVEEQVSQTFMHMDEDRYAELFSNIRRHGGYVPLFKELSEEKKAALIKNARSICRFHFKPLNRSKRKREFRKMLKYLFHEPMLKIASYIADVSPAFDSTNCNNSGICGLFNSTDFESAVIPSFADEATNSADYIREIIERYDMLPERDNVTVYMASGFEHYELTDEERRLLVAICNCVCKNRQEGCCQLIMDYKPELGKQTLVRIAAYNGKNIVIEHYCIPGMRDGVGTTSGKM